MAFVSRFRRRISKAGNGGMAEGRFEHGQVIALQFRGSLARQRWERMISSGGSRSVSGTTRLFRAAESCCAAIVKSAW
jgi:hypothetical protein